nr:hypothetical protein CFP56_73199 [Quercus suber]
MTSRPRIFEVAWNCSARSPISSSGPRVKMIVAIIHMFDARVLGWSIPSSARFVIQVHVTTMLRVDFVRSVGSELDKMSASRNLQLTREWCMRIGSCSSRVSI